jgi:hypothetical protein
MAIDEDFNQSPYFDDFVDAAEDKKFHRILFKPGYAVQARELTQLQSILQNQIDRFGYNVFKEGSEVSGAGQFLDNTYIARLTPTYAGVDINVNTFEGQYARGRTSQRLYYVKKGVPAVTGESDIVHLQYIKLANTTSTIANTASYLPIAGETLDFSPSANLVNNVFAVANSGAATLITGSSATANGLLFHVDEGIYYTNGFFVKNSQQTVAISANLESSIASIGFNVNSAIVTSDTDSTLLDPARGSYNYAAPGADRFKIDLTLTSTTIADSSLPNLTTSNYIEIARVQNGNIIRKNTTSDYNILGDELARRTFDESGHYSVRGLDLKLNNASSNNDFLTIQVAPGKAYVRGYEVENYATQDIALERARDTSSVTEQKMTAFYGNYVFANTLSIAHFDLVGDRVDLHANTTPTPGDKIGEAHIKNIEYSSGTGIGRIYKIFLYDVRITHPTLTFDTLKCIASGLDARALIHTSGINTITKFGSTTAGANTIVLNNITGVTKGQLIENVTHFPSRTVVTDISFDTITVSQNALLSNTNASLTFSSTTLNDSDFHRSLFPLPNKYVTGVTNVDYKFKRKFGAVSFASGSATIQTNDGTERFSSPTGSLVNENFFVIVKTGATGALANNENVDLTTGSRSVTTPTPTPGSPASAVINLDEAGFNGTADIVAAIDVTGDSRKVKTFANNKIKKFSPIVSDTRMSLGYSDVIRINAIYEGNASNVTSSDTDVTSNFIFDNGQRDNFYDHATIKLKPGLANTTGKILVDYNRFDHGGGLGFFVADSYPDYDTILTYRNQAGQEVYLRDIIDFRPVRSANASSTTYSASGKQFENHQIVDSQTFEVEMDYSYYLPRIDKLMLDGDGNFNLIKGASKLKRTPEPNDDPNQMTLATFKLYPYTYTKDDVETKIYNNARYTMKDIGNLERRIEKVEYYTSLNLLEQQINNRFYTDNNGNSLFKNGFVVDPFKGHNVGDVFNPDYKVSIDSIAQVLHPTFTSDAVPFKYTSGGSTLQKTGEYLTIPYSETAYTNQNTATGFININPFNVVSFVGTLKLNPASDIWVDNTSLPDIIVNNNNELDNLTTAAATAGLTNPQGTQWGSWSSIGSTGSTPFTGQNSTSVINNGDGTITTVTVNYELISETSNVISSTFSRFMRTRKINFTVDGMRPNTTLFMFMDGVNITSYMGPGSLSANNITDMAQNTRVQKEVTTDANGSANGFFFIPNDANFNFPTPNTSIQTTIAANLGVTWSDITSVRSAATGLNIRSGTVPVFVTDNILNTQASSTYALAQFTSEGRRETTQTTKYMEREEERVITSIKQDKPTKTKNVKGTGGGSAGLGTTDTKFTPDTDYTRLDLDSQVWQGVIASGAPAPIAIDAATYVSYTDTMVNLYETKLGKKPDAEGYKYWADKILREGDNPDKLVAEFNAAAEKELSGAKCADGIDPLAQTFFISADFYPKGITLTSVDLFFRTKDSNLPVRIEIRPTVNGFPSSTSAIPLTQVVKRPEDVNVPAPGDLTNLTPTNFKFDAPVHLLPGEYALVILTDSLDYTTFVSRIGAQKLGSEEFVTAQPNLGVLFRSQNARTWTPSQEEDLCFKLYRASFTTGTNYTATLNANNVARASYNASSNTTGQFDVASVIAREHTADVDFSSTYELQVKTEGGSLDSYVSIMPNQDIYFDTAKTLANNADMKFRITYNTSNEYISPYIDASSLGATLIKNRINNTTDVTVAETNSSGGDALAKYITRKVTLAEGFSATNLKVFLSQNMPQGSSIEVYYKVLNEQDDTPFNEKGYVQMTRLQTDVEVNEELNEFTDYEYYADGISYTSDSTTYNTFNQFAIKVVLYSSSSAKSPTVKNFRAIAFV